MAKIKMRKRIFLVALILMLSPIYSRETQFEGYILFDESHTTLDVFKEFRSLEKALEEAGYFVVFSSSEFENLNFDNYDVLVLALPNVSFSAGEKDALLKFLKDGGGILLIGEDRLTSQTYGITSPLNDLSKEFGIIFEETVVVDQTNNMNLNGVNISRIPIISNFLDHPVASDISEFFLSQGCSLSLSEPAFKLAWGDEDTFADLNGNLRLNPEREKTGENVVTLAGSSYKNGRIVAICDGNLWSHRDVANFAWTKDQIEFLDNKKLALNILEWLTLKTKITNANKYFIQGNELLGLHQYEVAKEKYLSALTFSKKLEDETRIASLDFLISKCEDGIQAEALFEEAESLYESEKFEDAKVKFEETEKLYLKIGDEIKAQSARERISKIEDKLSSIKEALKIFEDAKEKFDAQNFKEAKREFEQARDRFIQLGKEELKLEAESYISLCDQNIKARDDIDRYRTTIIIGGILILVLLIIYIFLRRT